MSFRLLELCTSPDFGGLEIYATNCVRDLAPYCTVIAGVAENTPIEKRLQENGSRYFNIKKKSKNFPLLAARKLAQHIDKNQIDVVHVHWAKDIPLAAFSKILSNRKPQLVSTRHMQMTSPKKDIYHRLIYSQVDLHIAITQNLANEMKKFLGGHAKEKITTLYLGADEPQHKLSCAEKNAIRKQLNIKPDEFLVGLFGRIKEFKGQHLLLEAIRLSKDENPFSCLIVGSIFDQEYYASLQEYIQRHRLESQVYICDFTMKPQELMQICDVITLTSKEETFGLVLIEAMRAGIPVVGSNRGGVPEIIEDENTGLLFESQNPVNLHEKIQALSSNKQLQERLANEAKLIAANTFNSSKHVENLYVLLKTLSK